MVASIGQMTQIEESTKKSGGRLSLEYLGDS